MNHCEHHHTSNKPKDGEFFQKPFKCDVCKKDYHLQKDLIEHVIAMHENIHPRQCKFCQKRFSSLSRLHEHQSSIHGVVRPQEPAKKTPNILKSRRKSCHTQRDSSFQSDPEDAKPFEHEKSNEKSAEETKVKVEDELILGL